MDVDDDDDYVDGDDHVDDGDYVDGGDSGGVRFFPRGKMELGQ